MSVTFGSARIDENGHITGGKAGDQTGKEVSTQSYYLHSKGWRVFRANDPEKRELIAAAMEAACKNNKIGYDQNQRNSLYNQIKDKSFDPAKATDACETDCSALVRVCVCHAGITMKDANTSNLGSRLLATGAFTELSDDKYTKQSAYLARGDILVTRTKGHTVAVLTSGSKAEKTAVVTVYHLGDRVLKNGMSGDDVKELQSLLIQLGYSCGSYGTDGDFGDATELAVTAFQKDHGCEADGEAGEETLAALEAAAGQASDSGNSVEISGGSCYVRAEPDTSAAVLGVAHEGDRLSYGREVSAEGWLKVAFENQAGWVSGKYGKVVA